MTAHVTKSNLSPHSPVNGSEIHVDAKPDSLAPESV